MVDEVGSETEDIRVRAIYRYPVKGLSPQKLPFVPLDAGQSLPFDRVYAIENGPGRFDEDAPRHLPKTEFLMLMRHERLARLDTDFDPETEVLTIKREGKQVARGALNTSIGRQMIEQFMSAFMAAELKGPPKIVFADGHHFADVGEKCVHIVNLASVRDLERVAGKPVDPLRFRANFYVDGLEAWSELAWIDRKLRVGDAELEVFDRTQRCNAINVDPVKGERDSVLLPLMDRSYGHRDMGIYAHVTKSGQVSEDDVMHLEAVNQSASQ